MDKLTEEQQQQVRERIAASHGALNEQTATEAVLAQAAHDQALAGAKKKKTK